MVATDLEQSDVKSDLSNDLKGEGIDIEEMTKLMEQEDQSWRDLPAEKHTRAMTAILRKELFDVADDSIEMGLKSLDNIISKTIFEDYPTKIILFLICLLTFTPSDQENVVISGESGIGKTYGLNEILWFFNFNKENYSYDDTILRFEGATPKSFIHKSTAKMVDGRTMKEIDFTEAPKEGDSQEEYNDWYDKLRNSAFFLDYSRKILVFPDMPDSRLLKNLRPILSHDREICVYEVTIAGKKGLKTKQVRIKGFFTSIFASAATGLDEQETSRHFLLSPTDDPKKIRKALDLIARKNSDPKFVKWYVEDKDRKSLKSRVQDIMRQKDKIESILLPKDVIKDLKEWFVSKISIMCPKTQRDFPRLIALAKGWALLNFRNRNVENKILWCIKADVDIAKQLYEPILECNELGLSPEEFGIWNMMKDVCMADTCGLTIKEIHSLFYKNKRRSCADKRLRGILKNFCRAGLLREEKDGIKLRYFALKGDSDEEEGQKIKTKDASIMDYAQSTTLNHTQKGELILKLLKGQNMTTDQIFKEAHKINPIISESDVIRIISQLADANKIHSPDGDDVWHSLIK